MNPEEFYAQLETFDIFLSEQQKLQFERYFELLVEWNEKINLTAITEKKKSFSNISMIQLHRFSISSFKMSL